MASQIFQRGYGMHISGMKIPEVRFVGGPSADLTIACVANCHADDAIRFLCAHIGVGASKILLYDDGIRRVEKIAQLPAPIRRRVEIIPVESVIPDRSQFENFNDVQRILYNIAYAASKTSWFAAIDVDEIIAPAGRDLRTQLQSVPSGLDMITLAPAEMVWPAGTRRYYAAWSAHAVRLRCVISQKDRQDTLLSRRGFTAHAMGKSIVRTNLKVNITVHGAQPVDGPQLVRDEISALLFHFDAISFPHWFDKARGSQTYNKGAKRSDRRTRLLVSAAMSEAASEAELFFDRHFCLTPSQIRNLLARDAVLALGLGWRLLFRYPVMFHRLSGIVRIFSKAR